MQVNLSVGKVCAGLGGLGNTGDFSVPALKKLTARAVPNS
jgi:hypothetical protein